MKVETLPTFTICLRPSQTTRDVYDFQLSLVGKLRDGQETVKSTVVWDFPGKCKLRFKVLAIPAISREDQL